MVTNQFYVFVWSITGGMLIGLVYDAFRIKRKAIKTSYLMMLIEDLLYWIIVALIMFGVVYYSNDGEIRGYVILGNVLGTIIYFLVFSNIIMKSAMAIIKGICTVVLWIYKIVSFPFKIIYKIARPPVEFIWRLLCKIFKKAGKVSKIHASRLGGLKRGLKNIRKKI